MSMFEGVNAAVYIPSSGNYEVFKISEIDNTYVAGVSYFSTRATASTWGDTPLKGVTS